MDRRIFLAGLGATSLVPTLSHAYAPVPYAPSTWRDVRDASDKVIVNFRASWSLTCQIKEDLLRKLTAENPDYGSLTFVDVDWDTFGPSEWVQKRLKVDRRSTLIAFRGKKEIGRLVNEPYERAIRKFLDAALTA